MQLEFTFSHKDVLVAQGESVMTDATVGKKDSKVNYLKFIPLIIVNN